MKESRVLALVGPTGVGKTEASIQLAETLNAEIISADSRQVYQGVPIGTAVPLPELLARVPHHFIEERALGEPWSAGAFAREAAHRIYAIRERGHVPLVVGGSTLYLEALLFGLAEVPRADPSVRAALSQRASTPEGAQALFEELQAIDPNAAATLDATKTQRLVRGLEVFQTTGRSWSSYYTEQSAPPFDIDLVVVYRPRELLYERINQRVDAMLAAGLLDENRSLLEAGAALDTNPLRTIGYQEPIAYLRGEIDYPTMVERLKRNSRRYAKRQLTWFRRWQSARWVNLEQIPVSPSLFGR